MEVMGDFKFLFEFQDGTKMFWSVLKLIYHYFCTSHENWLQNIQIITYQVILFFQTFSKEYAHYKNRENIDMEFETHTIFYQGLWNSDINDDGELNFSCWNNHLKVVS